MKYPAFIKKGDQICFIAPSFGAATAPYDKQVLYAKRRFEKLGYNVACGENAFSALLPYLSNEPQEVAKEFMDHYCDNQSQALISVGGGEFECLGLNYLDFTKLNAATPKWFMGFSDNTNHCYTLLTMADTASIYGCCAGQFGMHNWDQSIQDAYDLMCGTNLTLKGYPKYQIRHTAYQAKHPLAPYHLTEEKILTTYPTSNIKMEGRLIGGCLDILILLCGTKFDHTKEFCEKYKEDGFIWFLEACDLNSLAYKRAFWQLNEAGWFKYVKGFLIGRPQRAFKDDIFEVTRMSILDDLKGFNVPIVLDFDLGHIKPTMPLILGSYAKVEAIGNDITVQMELK